MKNILCISRIIPENGGGGANVYLYDILKYLESNKYNIYILLLDPSLINADTPWIWNAIKGTSLQVIVPGYIKIGSKSWSIKGVVKKIHNKIFNKQGFKQDNKNFEIWGNELSSTEKSAVKSVVNQKNWSCVIANYCWLSESLTLFKNNNVSKIILTHDVWHKHVEKNSDNIHLKDISIEREAGYLKRADIILAITDDDKRCFEKMLPGKKVITARMSCCVKSSIKPTQKGKILFIGSGYRPNIEGITWFLREVSPLLESNFPGRFHIDIVGAVGEYIKGDFIDGISYTIKGLVENLTPLYSDSEMVIIPILSGTGMKIKLIEALAHGKAIISTSQGASGLEMIWNKAFVIANEPKEFAEAIMKIHVDNVFREVLETASFEAAKNNLSPDLCYKELIGVIES